MGILIACIVVVGLCFFVFIMMGNKDIKRLENFKSTSSDLYEKYKDAFDSQPADFTGVQLTVESVESVLLPGEVILQSYALPRFYNKDANLFLLTDKRLIYVGIKLLKKEIKMIPYNKIENIELETKTLGTDIEITSKKEKVEIYFDNFGKEYLDKFYRTLTQKQLEEESQTGN